MQVQTLAAALINQASVTPYDGNCQQIIADILAKNGFDIQQDNINDTKNLLATKGSGRTLVLLGHTDVVPAGENWASNPFQATIKDNKLFGRGAVDMKAAVAAMVVAACKASTGRIAIMLTSDEEGSGENGIYKILPKWVAQLGKIDACLVGEPTSKAIIGDTIKLGRRGSINAVIEIIGQQGHAAYPELACNPINLSAMLINKLENYPWDLEDTGEFPKTRLVCTGIDSGSYTCNIIPNSITLSFNIRFAPSNSSRALKIMLEDLLKANKIPYKWKKWQPSNGGPYQSKPGKLTKSLLESIQNNTNLQAQISYDGGTSDGRFIAKYCDEVVEFGALNNTAHKANEFIALHDIDSLQKIYLESINGFFN